jgi:hypothetical protein
MLEKLKLHKEKIMATETERNKKPAKNVERSAFNTVVDISKMKQDAAQLEVDKFNKDYERNHAAMVARDKQGVNKGELGKKWSDTFK